MGRTLEASLAPPLPRSELDERQEESPRQALVPGICALIHTFNEERQIAECLSALQWCDEILVVDSFSTDRTREIVESFARTRVVQHKYYGAAAQKNWAMRLVQREWVLIFDADERCTNELRDEILALMAAGPRHEFYVIRRRTFYLGSVLRFSGFQNDRVTRLMRTGMGRYQNRRVHARVVAPDGALVDHCSPVLRSRMDHHMVESLPHHYDRVRRYAYWGAAQAFRDGRSIGLLGTFRRCTWRFLRTYLFQLGFLDGRRGLVFCATQAIGSFMKWTMLWSWKRSERLGLPIELPDFDEDPEIWTLPSPSASKEAVGKTS
jgi:glycosyltransferase involved in cell wall biosynthesis